VLASTSHSGASCPLSGITLTCQSGTDPAAVAIRGRWRDHAHRSITPAPCYAVRTPHLARFSFPSARRGAPPRWCPSRHRGFFLAVPPTRHFPWRLGAGSAVATCIRLRHGVSASGPIRHMSCTGIAYPSCAAAAGFYFDTTRKVALLSTTGALDFDFAAFVTTRRRRRPSARRRPPGHRCRSPRQGGSAMIQPLRNGLQDALDTTEVVFREEAP
jgi:hypothetical protein